MSDPVAEAAAILIVARSGPEHRIADLPAALKPTDQAAAYAIQHKVAATYAAIGGWKVGAAGPEAEPMCGALPATGFAASPARLSSARHPLRGIEAEICFRMAHDLPPRPTPYGRDEVVAAIAAAHPAIEELESSYRDPDAVDMLTNAADTQVHGGFIYGAPVVDWHKIDFANEPVEQYVDGALQMQRVGNPAGDMIRLMVWMANVGAVWAGGLKAGQFVTCGSWTGKSLVGPHADVRVRFPSVGEVSLTFTD